MSGAGTDGGNIEQAFGNPGSEGGTVGLHVHGKEAVAEVEEQLLAVAAPSGQLTSVRGDLPFAARLRRIQVEPLDEDLIPPGLLRAIGDPAVIGGELTLLGGEGVLMNGTGFRLPSRGST